MGNEFVVIGVAAVSEFEWAEEGLRVRGSRLTRNPRVTMIRRRVRDIDRKRGSMIVVEDKGIFRIPKSKRD